MKLEDLHIDIAKLNHSKASREKAVQQVFEHPEVIPSLIKEAYANNKHSHKVCWWLDFLNRKDIEILCPYIESILKGAHKLIDDSAIRAIARIIETFTLNYYSKKPNECVQLMMTPKVKEAMVELCFQWLIDLNLRVAPRAYAMISLFHLGKDISWVHQELVLVIEQNYPRESVAYQARARRILDKLRARSI